MVNWPWTHKTIEIARIPHKKEQKDRGTTNVQTQWTDKRPHPNLMYRYDELNNDPEVDIALDLLTDLITGIGFYTEMGEDIAPDHKHKQTIDEYCEKINADEKFKQITRTMLGKGFCPVEIIDAYELKILPPETFYIWKTIKGKVYRYTQEVCSSEVARWEGKDLNTVLLFINEEDTSHPYGHALTDSIAGLLDIRKDMNEDIGKALHRYAWPKRVHSYEMSIEAIKDSFLDSDIDEDIFLGNVQKGSFSTDTLEVNPNTKFKDSIELVYYQIAEGLHAPLLLYLKNATEASATVMMESVDRFVNGNQRYLKRRVEHFLFEPQVGEPVPRLVWGQPKTGLEDIALADIAQLYNSGAVKFNQVQDILKKLGLDLIEPEQEEWEKKPQLPFQPFQKPKPEIPMEQILEKLTDMQSGLNIIESNYVERRISVVRAMKLADKTITVYCKRAYPNGWKIKRDEEFERFTRRILSLPKPSIEYKVKVTE